MNSLLITRWPGAELLPQEGVPREAQQNILHPQEDLLGQRVPPPLAPRCPFLGATAACDSPCVWWPAYHTHGKRVRLSTSSAAVMGGDSSPAARARTSLRSDIAAGQGQERHSSHLPCPATSGHLHQTRGGVTSCQKHLGSSFASSPASSIWANSKHRSAGEFLVIMKAGSIKQTQQNSTDTVQRQKLQSCLLTHTHTSAVPGSLSNSFLSWYAECLCSISHFNGTARK